MSIKDKIKELFVSPDGKMSASKTWLNVAFTVATIIVIYMAVQGTLPFDFFIAYITIVPGTNLSSKFLSMKYTKKDEDKE